MGSIIMYLVVAITGVLMLIKYIPTQEMTLDVIYKSLTVLLLILIYGMLLILFELRDIKNKK